jgi:hypothetical protein
MKKGRPGGSTPVTSFQLGYRISKLLEKQALETKKKKGTVLDRGVTMMSVEYNNYHSGNRYRMYNLVTSRVVITHNAIWLGRMYFPRQATHNLDKQMPIVSVPINMNELELENNLETIVVVKRTNAPASKEREGTTNASSKILGDWVTARTQFGCEVGRKSGAFDPATSTTVKWADRVAEISVDVPDNNYNNVLEVDKDKEKAFKDNHNKLIKYVNIGAGIGGGFSNT